MHLCKAPSKPSCVCYNTMKWCSCRSSSSSSPPWSSSSVYKSYIIWGTWEARRECNCAGLSVYCMARIQLHIYLFLIPFVFSFKKSCLIATCHRAIPPFSVYFCHSPNVILLYYIVYIKFIWVWSQLPATSLIHPIGFKTFWGLGLCLISVNMYYVHWMSSYVWCCVSDVDSQYLLNKWISRWGPCYMALVPTTTGKL